jgi:hypothetical protein
MPDPPTTRQCDRCYFSRQIGERLCCIRNAPTADPATGQARWPIIHPTDYCGRFHPAASNRQCEIKNQSCRASGHSPNRNSSIVNRKCEAALPVFADSLGPYCKIPLTQGRFAKVDPEDYVWLSQFRWSCKVGPDACYAVRTVQVHGRSVRIFMHRQIMNTPAGLVCDHINHDGLDNRRKNCRNCTTAQNNANRRKTPHASSHYLGVSYDKRRRKWTAHIKKNGKQHNLGQFDTEAEAARAYDQAAVILHGVYAHLSFPSEAAEVRSDRG